MIFQYTLPQVLSGQKTQTRRIAKPNDQPLIMDGHIEAVLQSGRTKWKVGKSYAVQLKRGSKQVARIQIKAIRREEVDQISAKDARKEGFQSRREFLDTWKYIHGEKHMAESVWVLEFELLETPEQHDQTERLHPVGEGVS
jgi:hypothetical protein